MFKVLQQKLQFVFFLSVACLLTGCQSRYVREGLVAPLPRYVRESSAAPVRVALVLGGGGARGMAHAGVLEELERAGVPIDLIIGCSAGSIVGALYADHPDAAQVYSELRRFKSGELLQYSLFDLRYGFVHGHGLRGVLNRYLKAKTFDELQIPFIAVATDLHSGFLTPIGGGKLIPAVHASSAIPLAFHPVEIEGHILVDGGVVDPVPVRAALPYDPVVIVAVDVSPNLTRDMPMHLFGVAQRSLEISLRGLSAPSMKQADVVIRPSVDNVGLFDENSKEEAYQEGRNAARLALPYLQRFLDQRLG